MKIIAQTSRILIRQYVKGDEHLLLQLDADKLVTRYTPQRTPTETLEVFWQNLENYKTTPQLGRWAIIDAEDNSYIGNCMLVPARPGLTGIELGYALHQKYWGKGIATELVKALINYAFTQVGLTEICAITDPENVASQVVLKKCGFIKNETVFVLGKYMPLFLLHKQH